MTLEAKTLRLKLFRTTIVCAFAALSCGNPQGVELTSNAVPIDASVQEFLHAGDTQGTTYLVKYHGESEVNQSVIDSVL